MFWRGEVRYPWEMQYPFRVYDNYISVRILIYTIP